MDRASCPGCGSSIVFANKGSLATVCGHCRSVVRRVGVDLDEYGKIGAIREDASPVAIGSRGVYRGKRFETVGRLQLAYLEGTWNEWHLSFDDGRFGWLAEAQGFWSVFLPVAKTAPAPPAGGWTLGAPLEAGGTTLYVTNVGKARAVAGEGTLPFAVAGGYDLPFVDFSSSGEECATIDSSDAEARLFLGSYVDFESLQWTNLREDLPPDHPAAQVGEAQVEQLNCPNCAGGLERRTGSQSTAMYCGYCGSGIDLTQSPYSIFARQKWAGLEDSIMELGHQGTREGVTWTLIAQLQREAPQWDVVWSEYLFHNPKRGYRWLADDHQGHFTWYVPMHEVPEQHMGAMRARGRLFRHHEDNEVRVRRVAGELYWRVKTGDTVRAVDYTAPPQMLSNEQTRRDSSWSVGDYLYGKEVWKDFALPGSPPERQSIAPHQPAPQDRYFKPLLVRWAIATVVILVGCMAASILADKVVVASSEHTMELDQNDQPAMLDKNTHWVGPLEVPSGPTTLEVEVFAPVVNQWAYFRFGLYDEQRGSVLDFGQDVSRFSGKDSDGSWSEGSQKESVILPRIEAGTYYLRVEPTSGHKLPGKLRYTVSVRRGVPLLRWGLIAFLILSIPVFFVAMGKLLFEGARSQEG